MNAFPERRHGDRPCVLLAEDDVEMRKLLLWAISREGYDVVECRDGTELTKRLGRLDNGRPVSAVDVIVSDVRMPGVTGLQALETVRGFGGSPPIVLITAFPDQTVRDQAERLGAAELLAKPFDTDELVAIVRRLLAGKPTTSRRLETTPPAPSVQYPLDIVFRHGSDSPPVAEFVEELATKLNCFSSHINHARFVIDELHGHRGRKSRHEVKIHLQAGQKTIVVKRESASTSTDTIYLTIHSAFEAAHRRLRHYLKRRRLRESACVARQREQLERNHTLDPQSTELPRRF